MAIQFPNSPGIGSVFTDTDAGFSYEWTGVVWKSFTPAAANNIKELDDISSGFNNSTTAFNLTINGTEYQPINAAMLQISLGGVIQEPSTDYTVAGSTITFTTAPSSGLDFFGVVRGTAVSINYAADGNVQTKQEFTATLGQTSFTVTGGYTAGYIDVFRNGVRLGSDDFTDTSGTAIVLAVPAQADDLIETVKYSVASIVTTQGQLQNLNVSGISTLGVVTSVTSISSGVYYGDGSGLTGIDVTALKDSGGNVKAQANPGGVVITGVATATTFVGDLTGDLTGDVTGNADTATNASGLTGTPNISVGSVTAASGAFSGNVSVGGTLTYQDVSHIDAVGIITAQQGIQVLANGLDITGVSTFKSDVSIADKIIHTGDTNTAIRFPAADTFTVETSGSEAIRVDSSNRVLIGDTGSYSVGGVSSKVQVSDAAGPSRILTIRTEDGADGSGMFIAKSRNGATVENNDQIGGLFFVGHDGTDLAHQAAEFVCEVDGTPGGNDMPGRLVFKTTADGASSPTERLRINSSGNVGINTASPTATLDVEGTISDSIGPLRRLGTNTQSGDYTLVVGDAGRLIIRTGGNVTVPNGVFSAGDMVSIVNNASSDMTVTQGSSLTLYNTADSSSGSVTQADRSTSTVLFVSSSIAYISGTQLS